MDDEQLKALVNNEIEPYLQQIEAWQCITALGIKPSKGDELWYFHYGDKSFRIGGCGSTIDEAALDFYTRLKSKK